MLTRLSDSGHGDQVPARPGDTEETDGMDEAIVPSDVQYNEDGSFKVESLILDNVRLKPNTLTHLTEIFPPKPGFTQLLGQAATCGRSFGGGSLLLFVVSYASALNKLITGYL